MECINSLSIARLTLDLTDAPIGSFDDFTLENPSIYSLKLKTDKKTIPNLQGCTALTSLSIPGEFAQKLEKIDLANMAVLKDVTIRSAPNLQTVNFKGIRTLKNIKICKCKKLHCIEVEHPESLKQFYIVDDEKITQLPWLQNATHLKYLNVSGTGLTQLDLNTKYLQQLHAYASVIENINGLEKAKYLETLYISGNKKLTSLTINRRLCRLRTDSTVIKQINDLEDAKYLRALSIAHNTELNSLTINPLFLRRLEANGSHISTLNFTDNAPKLEVLRLDCSNIATLKDLDKAMCLRYISVKGTRNLQSLYIKNTDSLLNLDISESAVKELHFGDNPTKLERLGAKDCCLEELDCSGLPALKILDLDNIDHNKKHPNHPLHSIKLDLHNCNKLRSADLRSRNIKNVESINPPSSAAEIQISISNCCIAVLYRNNPGYSLAD